MIEILVISTKQLQVKKKRIFLQKIIKKSVIQPKNPEPIGNEAELRYQCSSVSQNTTKRCNFSAN